jgi:hypothetical protein
MDGPSFYVPESEGPQPHGGGEGGGGPEGPRPRRGGLRKPYVPGSSPQPEPPRPGQAAPEPAPAEPDYIDLNLDEILAPDDVPRALSDTPAAAPDAAARGEEGPGLYGVAEELLRLRRQIELRKGDARVLQEIQNEADSPAARDLIEAAFAAGFFAARGELERRIEPPR